MVAANRGSTDAGSVAAETGEMAISVFKNGSIEVYRIDDPDVLAGHAYRIRAALE